MRTIDSENMNFISRRQLFPVFAILLLTLIAVFVGCKKEEKETLVEIHVRDIDGFVVPNARVDLYADALDSDLAAEERFPLGEIFGYTDTTGLVVFDMSKYRNPQTGSDGFGVLDLKVEKDGFVSETVIPVREYETNVRTVNMRCSCFR